MSWKRGMRAMVTSLPDLLRLAVLCSSTLTILFLIGTCATSGSLRSQVSEPSSSACFKGLVCFWLPMFTCDSASDRPHSDNAHLLCVSAEYDGSCRHIPCQLSLLTGTCMKLLTAPPPPHPPPPPPPKHLPLAPHCTPCQHYAPCHPCRTTCKDVQS